MPISIFLVKSEYNIFYTFSSDCMSINFLITTSTSKFSIKWILESVIVVDGARLSSSSTNVNVDDTEFSKELILVAWIRESIILNWRAYQWALIKTIEHW